MPLKHLISSPLEAGQSVLDAHRLPSHLDAPLEYTARRLARKALSIDLVVVRRDYQLPHVTSTAPAEGPVPIPTSPSSRPSSALPSPALPTPASGSRFASAIKSLVVRSNTLPSSLVSSAPPTASLFSSSFAGGLASPTQSSYASQAWSSSSPWWPFSPMRTATLASTASSAAPSMPSTPATPLTPATSMDSASSVVTSHMTDTDNNTASVFSPSICSADVSPTFGIRLVHADDLPRSHKRSLCQILDKAARKFHLG